MADSYGDLLDAIALESRRPRASFGSRLEQCVRDAIIEAERETYWFNDDRVQDFDTIASQEYYDDSDNSFIPYITDLENLTIAISATDKRELVKKSWNDLQLLNESATSIGQPLYYAYAFRQIRLYPVPSDAWNVVMTAAYSLADLSGDADENCWTIERQGGLLVRYLAQAKFYGTHLRLADRAAQFQALAETEKARLVASTGRRQATGRIRRSL